MQGVRVNGKFHTFKMCLYGLFVRLETKNYVAAHRIAFGTSLAFGAGIAYLWHVNFAKFMPSAMLRHVSALCVNRSLTFMLVFGMMYGAFRFFTRFRDAIDSYNAELPHLVLKHFKPFVAEGIILDAYSAMDRETQKEFIRGFGLEEECNTNVVVEEVMNKLEQITGDQKNLIVGMMKNYAKNIESKFSDAKGNDKVLLIKLYSLCSKFNVQHDITQHVAKILETPASYKWDTALMIRACKSAKKIADVKYYDEYHTNYVEYR